jgi:hypothetical protein
MPNWCLNFVEIKGDEKDLDCIEAANMSFNKLVPCPEDELTLQGGEWVVPCDWARDNWGTKWDVDEDDVGFENDDGNIYVRFSTAWSPPIEFFEHLTKKMPSLEVDLKYWEGGCDFCGHCIIKGGEAAMIPFMDEKDKREFVSDYFGYDYEDEEEEDEEQDEEAKAVMKLVNDHKLQEKEDETMQVLERFCAGMHIKAPEEREHIFKQIEKGFRDAYEKDGDGMVDFRVKLQMDMLRGGLKGYERIERGKQLAAQA